MQTNSPKQQAVRHMTRTQKQDMMIARIEEGIRQQEAYLNEQRARVEFWKEAHAAGLTPAQLYALDMELMHGADVADLRANLCQF